MSFHRNLNGDDLHAPSIFLIENSDIVTLVPGQVLVVDGYNSVTRKFLVKLASDVVVTTDPQIDYVLGISKSTIPVGGSGSMDTFGVSSEVSILLTPNMGSTLDTPLATGNFVYVPLEGVNRGLLVSGNEDEGIKLGLIVNVSSTTSADILVLGLTSGIITSDTGTVDKVRIDFITSNTDPNLGPTFAADADGDLVGTFDIQLGTIDFVVQWYWTNPATSRVEVIDVDWTTNSLGQIEIYLPGLFTDSFTVEGYVEIVY